MNVSGPADWILGGWQAGGSLFPRTIDRCLMCLPL